MTAKRKQAKRGLGGRRTSKLERSLRPELAPAKENDPAPPKISQQLMNFCTHYAMFFHGANAVKHAEIETRAPYEYAHSLLTRPEIQSNIRWIRAQFGDLHFDLANQLLAQYNAMRHADPTEMLDAEGNLKDPADWPDGCKLLLTGIEVEESTIGEGENAVGMQRVKKVKLESRKGVIDSMQKVLGNFVQKVDHTSGGKPLPSAPAAVINVTVGGKTT